MPRLQTIDIDWEIHQLIEAERRDFDEAPYLALRRLLNLPGPEEGQASIATTGKPWIEDGVEVPHGSLARMEYLRGSQVFEGAFLDGKLVVSGKSYVSLSAAATALAKTRDGAQPQLNGWRYWKVQLPGETTWKLMADLRKASASKKT